MRNRAPVLIIYLSATLILALVILTAIGLTALADTSFGTSTPGGISQADRKYGHVDVLRKFHQGAPDWDTRRSQVVSFKYQPQQVNRGQHDAALRQWFRTAPKGPRIWWGYWHEPNSNFKTAQSKAAYRQAWRRISGIADRWAPNNLRSTYINTMSSVWKGTWDNYYPGNRYIDVLGFDGKIHSWDGRYVPAKQHYRDAVRLAHRLDKPWGLAEYGSTTFNNNYKGRANWMRDTARWLNSAGARFACWWDQGWDSAGNFKLNDKPGIAAFRWMLRGRWQ